ncbi:Beta-chimaerin [Arthrobotrys entomopaga]|nr:Beta-chimaerin [Arthrobotrys entomopaga]
MATAVQPRGGGGYPAPNGYSHHQNAAAAAGPSQQQQQQQQPPPPVSAPQSAVAPVGNTQLTQDVNEILQAEDFAGFLKKRAQIEEDHAAGLKKLCRVTYDTIHREDGPRRGTLMTGLEESNRIHERLADSGVAFASALNTMSEELMELANNIDGGRKQWKQAANNSEKKGPDSYHAMEKAKQKVDALAKEYVQIRNGERPKHFGIGGGRHSEEEARRRLEAADMEYNRQVEMTNKVHSDLFHNERPQTVKALRDLILECDAGLSLQLQKFVALNESFVLNAGRTISAAGGPDGDLRKALNTVDDERDMHGFIMEFASKAPPQKLGLIKFNYERHQILKEPPPPLPEQQQPQQAQQIQQPPQGMGAPFSGQAPPTSFPGPGSNPPGSRSSSGSFAYGGDQQQQQSQQSSFNQHTPPNITRKQPPTQAPTPKPLKPVFGVPLEVLLNRDGNAVPIIVIQCMTAVELYGLGVEGIYRQAGATSHIQKIREIFDNDPSRVDFRNPDHFFQDVNSVASALKQFLRDLPDPVLTYALYDEFIEAAKIDDDNNRRDSLHALINRLPDAHYATVRALVLHLYRVMQNSAVNKMNSWNLAVCFGPSLMSARPEDLRNTNWQHRALDTILRNALDIFDED